MKIIRVVATTALLITAQDVVLAANRTSTQLLSLDQNTHLKFWTMFFTQTGAKCDRAIRTMYQGGNNKLGDTWSVACADGNEYSVHVASDAAGSMEAMSCKELKAAGAMLSKLGGEPPDPNFGCWVKFRSTD